MVSESEEMEQALFDERQAVKAERDALRAEVERLLGLLNTANQQRDWQVRVNQELRAELAQERNERDATADLLRQARAENERLTLADKQWADHVKRLADERNALRAELQTEHDMRIDTDHACDSLRADNQRLQTQIADALNEIVVLNGSINWLRAEVERLKAAAVEIGVAHVAAQTECERLTADMGAWVHRQAELQAEIERLRHDLREALGISVTYEQKLTLARAENDGLRAELEKRTNLYGWPRSQPSPQVSDI